MDIDEKPHLYAYLSLIINKKKYKEGIDQKEKKQVLLADCFSEGIPLLYYLLFNDILWTNNDLFKWAHFRFPANTAVYVLSVAGSKEHLKGLSHDRQGLCCYTLLGTSRFKHCPPAIKSTLGERARPQFTFKKLSLWQTFPLWDIRFLV